MRKVKKKVAKKKVAKKAAKKSKKKTAKKRSRRRTAKEREESQEAAEFKDKYVIKWDQRNVSFTLPVQKLNFYGSWRKTPFVQKGQIQEDGIAYSIDIWCEHDGSICSVEQLHYIDQDPRSSMKSLNADICACVNKWLYFTQKGQIPTIPELQKSAAKPTLHFHRSGALDKMIIQLREFRNTCLAHGGYRAFILESDSPDDPKVTFQANFTKECHALDGKVPPLLGADSILNQAGNRKGRKSREKALPPTDSAQPLLDALQKAKDSGDKGQQRKIRGMLRKAGYRGGLRNAKKKD
jgi:hypothetical protein